MTAKKPSPLDLAVIDRETAKFLLKRAHHYATFDKYHHALAAIDQAAGLLRRAITLTEQQEDQ